MTNNKTFKCNASCNYFHRTYSPFLQAVLKRSGHIYGNISEKKKSKQAVISIVFFLEIMKKRKIQDILGEMNLLKEQETIAYNANNPISFD